MIPNNESKFYYDKFLDSVFHDPAMKDLLTEFAVFVDRFLSLPTPTHPPLLPHHPSHRPSPRTPHTSVSCAPNSPPQDPRHRPAVGS